MCLQKNRASPNFAQSELARLPNFLYLRESSQDIPKIMFKSYTSNDNLLLPPCLGDFIPQNDPVRVVHRIIEQINLEKLYRRYSPQGCSAYHPRMMLQILVYAYLRNIYSSRRIEEFCRNDIRFMWLTGNVTPDHNTINRFRSSRLKDVLKTIFATIVKFLVAEGFVSLDVACTDGTKMEADANRYTFVWGKSIHTRISRIAEQLEEIWQYAESVTKQELRDSAPITYQDITPEKVEKALCQIDDALNGVDADRKMKAKVRRVRNNMNYLTEHWLSIGAGVFLLSMVLYGHYRGFLKMATGVLTLVLSLTVVRTAVPYMTGLLAANTGLRRAIGQGLLHMSGLKDGGIGLSVTLPAQQRQSIENLKLPEQMKEILLENNNHEIYNLLGVDSFFEYLGASLANMVLNLIVSVVLFAAVYFLIRFVIKWLDLMAHLPILSGMNQIAGALLGAVQGLAVLWAAGVALGFCSAAVWAQPVLAQIEGSIWLSYLYHHNLFNWLLYSAINSLG